MHIWGTFGKSSEPMTGLCAGLGIFIALLRAGWLALYWRRENVSPES